MSETAFAARHTMDSPEWYTPTPFVEAARRTMGSIDLDPASHAEANTRVQAARFFTEADNSLDQTWAGNVFLNPPGGLVAEFWRCFIEKPFAQGIWIGYSLEQLQTLQQIDVRFVPMDFPMCITKQRIAFVENEAKQGTRLAKIVAEGSKPDASPAKKKAAAAILRGKIPPSSPSHSNYVVYRGPDLDAFEREFAPFGYITSGVIGR